jgi:allantoinase
MMLIQHHKASEYSDRALDQFEQIYHDSAKSARITALVVHPYIMGAPHRLKYFRKVLERSAKKAMLRSGPVRKSSFGINPTTKPPAL